MEQSCQDRNRIAIVGGGPSGIYCALHLLKIFKESKFSDFELTIFDKAPILRTILPTGNLRCNITNSIYDIREFASNYPRGEKFLYSLFARHSNYDSIEFFNSIGIETYIQDDGRVFPVSNSSKDVKEKLLKKLFSYKKVRLINKEILSIDDLSAFNKIVVSCGSRSNINLLKSLKVMYLDFTPVLCALNIENPIYPKGVSIKSLDGDFVFTDSGISGPLAFKISSLYLDKKMPFEISINLFNAQDLIELVKQNPKKSIGLLVSKFVPKSLAHILVKDFYKNACEISEKDLYSFSKISLKIISRAKNGEIVNSGGVCLDNLDKNCKLKKSETLWFCGEIIDVDGFCGGFNLQNCWSTAYVVAQDIAERILSNK